MKDCLTVIVTALMIGCLVWFSGAIIGGCGGSFIPPGPPVPPDAGTVDDCDDACDNLAWLSCPGWEGSPGPDEVFGTIDDVSCAEVCRVIVGGDSTATLHQVCTAAAATCEAVDQCFD